jgi:lipoprotein-anchoring transpeptidase ErfK/SrfK
VIRQPAVVTPAAAREPTSGWIATLAATTPYSATPGGPLVASLGPTNPFSGPQTLAVVGAPNGAWLHVELPVRPNGSTGWIPASAARLTWTPYSIQVSLSAHTLTLRRGTQVVLRSAVAVGASSTPTPPDHTYVWELVKTNDPAGAYGPYIFGLAEFSDAYSVFNGGDAQIGIHGSNEPWLIGQAASHGCVRLPNPTVSELVGVLPLGTPVTVG